MKIITTNNHLLRPLYQTIETTYAEATIDIQSEDKAIEKLITGEYDAAIVSPYVYSNIGNEFDYKIVKTNLLITEDFTGDFSINVRKGLRNLNSCYTEIDNKWVNLCCKLVLSERYQSIVNMVESPQNADVILSSGTKSFPDFVQLDLSEDWYDTFEIPLIQGFWIAKNTKQINEITDMLTRFSSITHPTETVSSDTYNDSDYRQVGVRYWTWKDDFVSYFEKTFDLLFYHNHSRYVADVLFLGYGLS